MKKSVSNFLLATIWLLSVSNPLFSQTKKEVQFSLDTLVKSHQTLLQDYNNLQDDWRYYDSFYEHVKTNLFPKQLQNLPITEAVSIFDTSLEGTLKTIQSLTDSITLLADSLNTTHEDALKLQAQVANYSEILMAALNASSFPQTESDLLGSWDLFLNPIQINGAPGEAGIISYHPFNIPDSIQQHRIYKIEFSPDDLATLVFQNGENQKCFYSIQQFNPKSNYTIQFSKQDEFKLLAHISVLPQGLQISYEIPVQTNNAMYFQGLMKK